MKFALVILVCAVSVFGQATGGTTNHYEVLKKEQMFCIAGGNSGAVTPAGHSLMAVAKQKDAAAVFTKLTREEAPPDGAPSSPPLPASPAGNVAGDAVFFVHHGDGLFRVAFAAALFLEIAEPERANQPCRI